MTNTAEETIARLKEKAEAVEDEQETFEEVAEVEEATKKHGDSTREYVVLSSWSETGRITASSSRAAIESLPEGAVKNGAKYVAVPARNWNEHEIVVETKTTVTIK